MTGSPACGAQGAAELLADLYAEDGVERPAGKGWRELEKEQQLRDNADIAGEAWRAIYHARWS
jgi:hypothetical protein